MTLHYTPSLWTRICLEKQAAASCDIFFRKIACKDTDDASREHGDLPIRFGVGRNSGGREGDVVRDTSRTGDGSSDKQGINEEFDLVDDAMALPRSKQKEMRWRYPRGEARQNNSAQK